MKATIFAAMALVLLAMPIASAMENVDKCEVGLPCQRIVQVWNNSWVPYTTQICNITIYYPNLTLSIDQASMQNNTGGIHNYTYTPQVDGYHPCMMWCFDSGDEAKESCDFVVESVGTVVSLTDNAEIQATEDYEAQVIIIHNNRMTDADTAPVITIYSSNGSATITEAAMENLETGRYNYSFTTTDGDAAGVWKTVTVTTVNGRNYTNVEFWEIESNPAEVTIDVIDNTINQIVCRINITNEGTSSQEYIYRYWITDSPIGPYESAIASGMASKLIAPGESFITDKVLMLSDTGTHYCKTDVFWGTEKSKASDQFLAVYSGGDYGGAEACGGYTLLPEEPTIPASGPSGSKKTFVFRVWNGDEAQHFFMGTSVGLWEICNLVGYPEYPTPANGYAEFRLECTVQDAPVTGEAVLTSDSGCYDTRELQIGVSSGDFLEDLEWTVDLLFAGDIYAMSNDISFGENFSLPFWAVIIIFIVIIIIIVAVLRAATD